MSGGSSQTTGNPLDVSITGEGFFQIGEGNPGTAGQLADQPDDLHPRGQLLGVDRRLPRSNSAGQYVVGYQLDPGTGNPITTGVAVKIPDNATSVAIDPSGGVSWIDGATGTRTTGYRLTIANFANASGLERVGGNAWAVSANSGNKTVNTPGIGGAGALGPGTLEMSNVDLSQTFTNMITAQRGFQANSRVISTADDAGPGQPQARFGARTRVALYVERAFASGGLFAQDWSYMCR